MKVDALFAEFAERYRAGEAPDVADYIARAGDEGQKLAEVIVAFVEVEPIPAATPQALARSLVRPEIAGLDDFYFGSFLRSLRKAHGKTRTSVAGALADSLGLGAKQEAVEAHYADLEDGLLTPDGLDRRVIRALAEALETPAAELERARRTWQRRSAGASHRSWSWLRIRRALRTLLPAKADITSLFPGGYGESYRRALSASREPGGTLAGRALIRPAAAALLVATAAAVTIAELPGARAAAVEMSPFTPACAGDSTTTAGGNGGGEGVKGRRIVVAGVWNGEERANFRRVLERFEEKTGAQVAFRYETRDIARTIKIRLDHDCPPDVALLPQRGLLADLQSRGALEAIDFARDRVRANYAPFWRRLGMVDNTLFGVWFKAANKSTLWFNRSVLETIGARPPTTWTELKQVAAAAHAADVKPFSVAGADGWTLTDWFENVYLRTAGSRRYHQLAAGKIGWSHPSVRKAFRVLSEVFDRPEWLAGGTRGALLTDFEDSVSQVFSERPDAAMVYEGDFVAGIARAAGADVDEDSEVVDFPAIRRPGMVAGGDVAVLFTKNEAARQLIRFLATPEAAEPWAKAGGFLSPNRRLDPDSYGSRTARRWAQKLVQGRGVQFDLSDLQPPAFGASPDQGMWKLFRDYLERPDDTKAITRRLDRVAAKAKECDEARRRESRTCKPRLAVGPPDVSGS